MDSGGPPGIKGEPGSQADVDNSHEAFRLHSTRLRSPGERNTTNSKGQTFSLSQVTAVM